ncbi:MAG: DUF4126 domain-containing protein [Kineosporiaceae bacterium]
MRANRADTLDEALWRLGLPESPHLPAIRLKAGIRAAVHTSPKPASNVVVSTTEDLAVAGMVAFGITSPWLTRRGRRPTADRGRPGHHAAGAPDPEVPGPARSLVGDARPANPPAVGFRRGNASAHSLRSLPLVQPRGGR